MTQHDGKHDGQGRNDVVRKLVEFQETGKGFDSLWSDIHSIVEELARRNLMKIGVKVRRADPNNAVGEVVSETCLTLKKLSLPGACGRFRPEKMKSPGISGVRAWLWRVVRSKAVNWWRDSVGGRGVLIRPETGLEWNELPQDGAGASIVKRVVAKMVRPDLLPIIEACINEIQNPQLQCIVRLQLHEGLSRRRIAKRLKMPPATVHHRLRSAYKLLAPLLEQRGVDLSWVAA